MKQWLEDLKLAIILENEKEINLLSSNLPDFDNLDDAHEAQALLKEALSFIMQKRNEVRVNMEKINRSKKFLDSDNVRKINRLLDYKL